MYLLLSPLVSVDAETLNFKSLLDSLLAVLFVIPFDPIMYYWKDHSQSYIWLLV